MTVSELLQCPRCGARRAAQTPPDLCPACLLATALSMDDEPCPYQVVAPMGEDSRGVTYLAQGVVGVPGYVALKIHGPRDDTEEVLLRYQRWRPVLARVQHSSIGKLLDVGLTAEGRLYVASEYVAGWPLTALRSHPAMGVDERDEMGRQLNGAIDAAHAAGVRHLKLDTLKVKISTANGLRATILGFGSCLIVEGVDGPPEVDRLALAHIVHQLGIQP